MFGHLKPNGCWITEDTHTSYWPAFGGGYTGGVGGLVEAGDQSFTDYAKNMADTLNWHHMDREGLPKTPERFVDLYGQAKSVHFYDSLLVIEKGDGEKDTEWPYMVDSSDRSFKGQVPLYIPDGWQPCVPYYLRKEEGR
jgi:hypothetical protein